MVDERSRARSQPSSRRTSTATRRPVAEPPPLGSLSLAWRGLALRIVEAGYRLGVGTGSALMLLAGGFVPVTRRWLRDEIDGWPGVVRALGGVTFTSVTRNPDADLGPMLARVDASPLFSAVEEVARKLGVKAPSQIRVTYLPCCGVVAWENSRALILGLPLLRVLTLAELRAVLAHELAHLARGDATRAARSVRFVEGLGRAVEQAEGTAHGPLYLWARICLRAASRLIGPVACGQEARADRFSASIAGGGVAASALVKVALVQPLFREVLDSYDPTLPETPNLYAFFRAFWFRLPPEIHSSIRLQLLADGQVSNDPAHPPLADRLAWLQRYPDSVIAPGDNVPATTLIGDLEIIEELLHNRLFGSTFLEPSVFHQAGR